MASSLESLNRWVEEVARLTQPAEIQWCNGSDGESRLLKDHMLARGDLLELNQETHPGCTLHRSSPTDVARVEHQAPPPARPAIPGEQFARP